MDDAKLLSVLNRINTWWEGEKSVPDSLKKADYQRRDFYPLKDYVMAASKDRRILTLRGPRQVGKTTMCGQLIQCLLRMGFRSESILYLTIENSQILGNTEGIIQDTLEAYETHVLGDSFGNIDSPVFVFIDEIQKAESWADTLKYYTDTYDDIFFFVTGSVSTLIQDDAQETLVGRLEERIMMPLKFVDVVDYDGVFDDQLVTDTSIELRSKLANAVRENGIDEFKTQLSGFYGRHHDKEPRLTTLEDEYLLKGGYPGVLDENYVDAYSELDTNLRYTVTGDLATVFNVKKSEKVLTVLRLIADATTGKINVQKIANSAGVNRDTVERFIDYLEEFFLVSRCRRYSTSEFSQGGRDKLYLQDVGLFNALQGTLTESTISNESKMGPILETAVADHARRLQFYLSNHQSADIQYWDRVGEVDFVLSGSDYVLPIEVKHGNSVEKDLRGLESFVEDGNARFGIAVNKAGELRDDGSVIHIPSWMFLFLC